MIKARERGVALLIMLVLVATMSTVAVAGLEDIRFGLRRRASAEALAQARWLALGAESFAGVQIARLQEEGDQKRTNPQGWVDREIVFPIEGGAIAVRLSDGGNCFNLNGLAPPSGEAALEAGLGGDGAAASALAARRQFLVLLRALGSAPREAEAIADAVVDWVDADQIRSGAGWEDDVYARRPIAYRTSGAPLAERSELRAIAGFDEPLYQRLKPFVCALPRDGPSIVNPNTLTPEQAPLLAMATYGAVSEQAARALINARPAQGYDDLEAVWATLVGFGAPRSPEAESALSLQSRYYALDARIVYLDRELTASALLGLTDGGGVRTAARRWTEEE